MQAFIYGTLKKNRHNHWLLKEIEATYICTVKTYEKYPLFELDEPFPYLQNNPGIGEEVKGELYEIKDEFIDRLDYFEGSPDLYHKNNIKVTDGYLEYDVVTYFKTELLSPADLKKLKLLKNY